MWLVLFATIFANLITPMRGNGSDGYLSRLLDRSPSTYAAICVGGAVLAGGVYWWLDSADAAAAQKLEAAAVVTLRNMHSRNMYDLSSTLSLLNMASGGQTMSVISSTQSSTPGRELTIKYVVAKQKFNYQHRDRTTLEQSMNNLSVDKLPSTFYPWMNTGYDDLLAPLAASRTDEEAPVTLQYGSQKLAVTLTAHEYIQLGRLYRVSLAAHTNVWIRDNLREYIQRHYDAQYQKSMHHIQKTGIWHKRLLQVSKRLATEKQACQERCIAQQIDLITFAEHRHATALTLVREIREILGNNPWAQDVYPYCPGIIYNLDEFPAGGYTPFSWSPEHPWDYNEKSPRESEGL